MLQTPCSEGGGRQRAGCGTQQSRRGAVARPGARARDRPLCSHRVRTVTIVREKEQALQEILGLYYLSEGPMT